MKSGILSFLASLPAKIIVPALLTVALSFGLGFFYLLPVMEEQLMDARRGSLRAMAGSLNSLIQLNHQRYEKGELSLEQAQGDVIRSFRSMRCGPDGRDYIWIHNMAGTMIMHPHRPDLEGRDVSGLRDLDGQVIFRQMNRLVRHKGAGFVRYRWQRSGVGSPEADSEAFVKGFDAWGWVVGTGMYLDDVALEMSRVRSRFLLVIAFLVVLISLLSVVLIRASWRAERERQKVTEKLGQSRERYRLLAENIDDVIWTTDLNLQLTYISPSVERLLGIPAPLAVTLPPKANLTRESFESARTILVQEMAQQLEQPDPERTRTVELEQIRADGRRVFTEARVRFMYDDQGQPVGLLGVSRDVTARKKAERQRQVLEKKLMEAQRLEAIGTLAGGIAHDFNNILAAILGFAHEAKNGADENARADLDEVIKAAERARDLVQQILTFSRQVDHETKPLQIGPVIGDALKMLRSSLPASIKVDLQVPGENLYVLADPTQIHQVLINLGNNAAQAMAGKAGTLTIKLEKVRQAGQIWLRYPNLRGKRICLLSVRDTGPGIEPQVMDRLFEPFYTTKEVGVGTGLGLSVVHGIVAGHGGRMEVESSLGEGATFKVFLPLVEPTSAVEQEPGPAELPTGSEHILLVDDETSLVVLNTRLLESLGYRVTSEWDGRQALEMVRTDPQAYDLVLTDQFMPGMTGTELALEIQRLRSDLPVIVATGGSAELATRSSAVLAGVNEVLLKPISRETLAAAVRRALDA